MIRLSSISLKINKCRSGKYGFLFDLLLFISITLIFHQLWWRFQSAIQSIHIIPVIQEILARSVFHLSLWIDRNVFHLTVEGEAVRVLRFDNQAFIRIDRSCAGLKQFYQILVLFILFPGPWKHKLWFIPSGWIIMYFTNIFRIVALSFVSIYLPEHWHFIHDWVLRPFFYVVLFGLWVIWVEKFSRTESV